MFYSFKLITPPLDKQTPFNVYDGKRKFTYFGGRERTEHYYCNLLVDEKPIIDFPGEYTLEELAWGEEAYFTPEQVQLNTSLTQERGINYRVTVAGVPRQAIITGPQYAGDFGPVAPYAMLRAERFEIEDTLYISFQDPYFSHGSYFLSDNEGNNPLPAALEIIRENLDKHQLKDSQITFVGVSKGANIAAMLSQHFTDNQLILCAYAMDLEHWVRNTGLAHIGLNLDYLGIEFPNSLEIFQHEADRKETHWFYSKKDPQSNRGLEDTIQGKYLTKHPCDEMHGEIIHQRWDEIKELILRRHGLL